MLYLFRILDDTQDMDATTDMVNTVGLNDFGNTPKDRFARGFAIGLAKLREGEDPEALYRTLPRRLKMPKFWGLLAACEVAQNLMPLAYGRAVLSGMTLREASDFVDKAQHDYMTWKATQWKEAE